MPAYTYGDYVYFNKNIDAPNEHHNNSVLNHTPYFYITSLSKLMDDTFTQLPQSFVEQMIKKG